MIDFHTHTNMSYCAPSLSLEVYADFIRTNLELEAVYVTDHGMAVYFPSEIAWKWEYISDSKIFDLHRDWGNSRLSSHLAKIAKLRGDNIFPGLEVEMMHDGRLTIDASFRKEIDILIGSVHYLNTIPDENRKTVLDRWEKHTKQLINSGIDILGHPFRWINNQLPISRELVRQMVKEAKNAGIALELNGHFVVPTDIVMLQACVEFGVPVSLATDSHTMKDIGDFSYHFATIEAAGLSLASMKLFTPRRAIPLKKMNMSKGAEKRSTGVFKPRT